MMKQCSSIHSLELYTEMSIMQFGTAYFSSKRWTYKFQLEIKWMHNTEMKTLFQLCLLMHLVIFSNIISYNTSFSGVWEVFPDHKKFWDGRYWFALRLWLHFPLFHDTHTMRSYGSGPLQHCFLKVVLHAVTVTASLYYSNLESLEF